MSPNKLDVSSEMSKMHRFMVGDVVEFNDESEFPPVKLEGEVIAFANEEKTYLECNFDEKENRVLTEDEVRRVS